MNAYVPAVSIVVPVHNAGEFIEKCLTSLFCQTLEELEIVIVLNGCTDDSEQRILALPPDPRLRVLRQTEANGASAARNLGLQAVTGRFVGFVDADDYCDPTMFEELLQAASSSGAEIAGCGMVLCDSDGTESSRVSHPLAAGQLISQDQLKVALLTGHSSHLLWFTCRNLYRRELLERVRLQFDPRALLGEDVIFNLEAFFNARSAVVLDAHLYHYRQHGNNSTAANWRQDLPEVLGYTFGRRLELVSQFQLGEAAILDLRQAVQLAYLPRLIGNAVLDPTPGAVMANIDAILRMPMVVQSLPPRVPLARTLPIGLRITCLLARFRQTRLIGFFYTSRLRKARPTGRGF